MMSGWILMMVLAINILLIAAVLWLYRRVRITESRWALLYADLRLEISMTNNAAVSVGQNLIRVEKKAIKLLERIKQLESSLDGKSSYQQANQMLASGAGLQQIVERCGLPEEEVKLIVLHGKR